MKTTAADDKTYVGALTGVRAIAAGSVVLFHYLEAVNVFRGSNIPWLRWLLDSGQHGVTLFFVLSGVLITSRYQPEQTASGAGFWKYWLRRFIRIYPVYAVTLLGLVILPELARGNTDYRNPAIVLGLFALGQGFSGHIFALGIPIAWTLTVEEIYYLLAPWLASWLRASGYGLIAVKTLGLIAASLTLFYLIDATRFLVDIAGYHQEQLHDFSFFARFPEFAVGAACGTLVHSALRPRLQQRAQVLQIAGGILAIAGMLFTNYFFFEKNYAAQVFARVFEGAGIAVGLLGLAVSDGRDRGSLWLGSPVLDYLGKTSYALYLVHLTIPPQLIWGQLQRLPIHPLAAVPMMYIVSVAASVLLYEWIEKPIHTRLQRRWFPSPARAG